MTLKHTALVVKQDLHNIKRVPLAGLLIFALAVLPSLYAWFNIGAAWDPYANTEGVEVAVVNEDEGTTLEGEAVNLGEEVTASLADNDSLGWAFVDRDEAEQGVREGDYYASIQIGADFSQDIGAFLDGEPRQAEVHYEVNEKVNAIAPKMTDSGATTVTGKMNEEFTKETSQAMLTTFDKIGLTLEEELPAMKRLMNAVYDVEDSLPAVKSYTDAAIYLDENREEIASEREKLSELTALHPEAEEGAQLILAADEKMPEIRESADEALELKESLPDMEKLADDLSGVEDRLPEFERLLSDGLDQAEQIQTMLGDARSELEAIEEKLASAAAAEADFAEVTSSLETGTLTEDLADVSKMISESAEQAENVHNELEQYEEIFDEEELDDLANLTEALNEADERVEKIEGYVLELLEEENIDTLEEQLETSIEDGQAQLNNAQEYIKDVDEAFAKAERSASQAEEGLTQAEEHFPQIEAVIADLQKISGDSWTEVQSSLEAAEDFIRSDLPVMEEKTADAAAFIRTDLQEAEESATEIVNEVESAAPAVDEAVTAAADFGRYRLPDIDDGVSQAADELRELEEERTVSELIDVLQNDLADESAWLREPVALTENQLFPVPNYGSANVPFYSALALWVGALLLANLVSTGLIGPDRQEKFTSGDVYFGRGFLFIVVGALQGLIVSIGNLMLLGTYAEHPVMLVTASIFIGVVFMLIVYTLVSVFGNIGKAIAIVFLVLQLSAGGGMFPIETAPPFFQAVHPYLPFTYAIDLLREAVGGAVGSVVRYNVMILLSSAALSVLVGIFLKPLLAEKIEKTSEKSKSSRLID
ncbi:YhgE/Pip domain-containing protein [Salisediminibacterium halotolerans]|uniref:Membrane protein n=1 Tax=Salisediminibacterium halotolerans TaxID=517425 RepID=A0A1H9W8U5_9BACI|nr:YhgE/Pip domain-containing protein [Salisediminibacterium haloalkalitolerans]SES29883.1 putative membrane protein [Salisediminibacterium haloalkalitolerans]